MSDVFYHTESQLCHSLCKKDDFEPANKSVETEEQHVFEEFVGPKGIHVVEYSQRRTRIAYTNREVCQHHMRPNPSQWHFKGWADPAYEYPGRYDEYNSDSVQGL